MPPPTAPSLDHLSLPVADLERSLRFYVGVLGMRVLWQEGAMVLVRAGQHADLALNQSAAPISSHALHFGFKVGSPEEVRLWAEYLRGMGVESVAENGPQVYFRDPDGYTLEIYYSGP